MPPPSFPPLEEVINENGASEQPPTAHFPENQTGRKVDPTPVSGPLKRKRPPTIEIPNVLREIPFRDLAPQNDTVCFSGSGVGVCSVKGKKKFMEDTHKIVSPSNGTKGFFGVYDGHGGRKAVEFVAENLHSNVFKMLENRTGNSGKEEAVKAGYLRTDQEFLQQGLGSGACCVTALIEGNEIVVSNLGDCRAVLCRGGVAEALTKDHRAGQEDERKRIESKGGYVEIHRGAWRVHGVLSVSRSIGDAHLKDWVLAEPDTRTLNLTPDMEYLVLASDGLWEEVGNQEAVDIVMRSCLVEKKIPMGHNRDENGDGFGFLSTSSSPVVLVKPKKKMRSSPRQKKTVSRKDCESGFACENESPLSKTRRISSQIDMKIQSPSHERNSYTTRPASSEPDCNELVKTVSRKECGNGFACENESPPSKIRRISSQLNTKTQSPNQEHISYKKRPDSNELVATCTELVTLAVTRGSLDDITVMIIDLNHFK